MVDGLIQLRMYFGGRVTVIDGLLSCAVLLGLALNLVASWWWADPGAGPVIVYYALREARAIRVDVNRD